MKKYAMILMGKDYETEKDKAIFIRGKVQTHILTVRNEKEALTLAKKLKDEGFGAIEVCGAFGENLAQKMYEETGRSIPVSYVTTPENQISMVENFWTK